MDRIKGKQLVDGLVDIRRWTREDGGMRDALRNGHLVKLSSRYAAPRRVLRELRQHEAKWLEAVAVGKTMPKAVLSGRSAARVHGMWVVATTEEPVDLVLPSGAPPPRHQWPRGCRYSRGSYVQDEVTDWGALRLTSPVRTAVDIALRHGFREGLVALDWVLAHYPRETVEAAILARGRARNIGVLRKAFAHAVPDSRSPFESYARAILIEAGHLGFIVNARVGPYVVDLLCGRLIWEIDGDTKYDGPPSRAPMTWSATSASGKRTCRTWGTWCAASARPSCSATSRSSSASPAPR